MHRWQQTAHIMGSDAWLTIVTNSSQQPDAIFAQLWQLLQKFDERFSRFKPSSELTQFNQRAGNWQLVSKDFFDFLTVSNQFQKYSGGLYNPFTLPALQRAGYVGSWPTTARFTQDIDFRSQRAAADFVILLRENHAKIPPDSAIDSGGLGKGYALDKLADLAEKNGITNYWFSLGGDIISCGHDVNKNMWRITIDSTQQTPKVLTMPATRCAVATSGVQKRRGKSWHHIIDPRTMLPAESQFSQVTVMADSATAADCYATCLTIDPLFKPGPTRPKIVRYIGEESVRLKTVVRTEK